MFFPILTVFLEKSPCFNGKYLPYFKVKFKFQGQCWNLYNKSFPKMSLVTSNDQLIAEKIEFEVLKLCFDSWKLSQIFIFNLNFLIQYLVKWDNQGQFWKALAVQIPKLSLGNEIHKIFIELWDPEEKFWLSPVFEMLPFLTPVIPILNILSKILAQMDCRDCVDSDRHQNFENWLRNG